jgi:hypothetical protein
MKKVKFFYGKYMQIGVGQFIRTTDIPDIKEHEEAINEFLARDNKDIKIISVEHRLEGYIQSVMVYYEELN